MALIILGRIGGISRKATWLVSMPPCPTCFLLPQGAGDRAAVPLGRWSTKSGGDFGVNTCHLGRSNMAKGYKPVEDMVP